MVHIDITPIPTPSHVHTPVDAAWHSGNFYHMLADPRTKVRHARIRLLDAGFQVGFPHGCVHACRGLMYVLLGIVGRGVFVVSMDVYVVME